MALSDMAGKALQRAMGNYGSATEVQAILNSASQNDANGNQGAIKGTSLAIGTSGAEVTVTATPAELNVLHGVTPGTQAASLAIVTDSHTNQGAIKATSLAIGVSGSEVALTATVAKLNQYCDDTTNTATISTTKAVAATDSGKTFYLSGTPFVTTLPAPAAGLRYEFIVAAAPSGASFTIVTTGSSNIIKGLVLTAEDAGGSGSSSQTGDTITFVDSQAVAGDCVEIRSDGTSWFAKGFAKVAAGVTITTAS